MSLSQRLLLSLSLVLIASFCLFGILEYQTLRTSLLQEVDRNLQTSAESVARRLPAGNLEAHLEELVDASDPLAGIYVEVLSGEQRVVYASPNLQQARLPWPEKPGIPQTVDKRVRVLSLRTAGATVLVGQSLHDAPLLGAGKVFLAGVVTLSLALLVTSLVLQRGLQPLGEVADTARYIGRTGDVRGTRVPVPPGPDEVVQVALALNSLLERVDQLLEVQFRLLADTSHELRNPLTVIRTDIDMLAQDLDAATRLEVTSEASLEVGRMIRLVEHLLLISWAETRPHLSNRKLRLDTLARRLTGRQEAVGKDHVFEVEIPDQPVWVFGDSDRIAQILTNLLDNAVRHTPAGTRVRVVVQVVGALVQLAVSDNGPGIAPRHLAHIFERFYRVDPSRSRGSGGTGLGLPLAQALARLHGGKMLAESSHGCCFTLQLPLTEADT